jgi:hypothetical protein
MIWHLAHTYVLGVQQAVFERNVVLTEAPVGKQVVPTGQDHLGGGVSIFRGAGVLNGNVARFIKQPRHCVGEEGKIISFQEAVQAARLHA